MSEFKVGDKVRTIEEHGYLGLRSSDVGTIIGFEEEGETTAVQFDAGVRNTPMLFTTSELIRVQGYVEQLPSAEGVKHDQEKPDMSCLSPIAMVKVAQVMTFGKRKYAKDNWRGGISYTRLIAASLRHIFSYLGGESLDPETGVSHLAHAICDLQMILEFEDTMPEMDDRYKQKDKK